MKSSDIEKIQSKIHIIRDQKVMLDSDLAELYGVETKVLNQAIKRNLRRFPKGFMFQLTEKEFNSLRSQFVTSKRGGRRYLPYVFTEHGTVMLASVLNSNIAIQVNIQIVEAFIQMRRALAKQDKVFTKLDQLEKKTLKHDKDLASIFEAIRQLLGFQEKEKKKRIGF